MDDKTKKASRPAGNSIADFSIIRKESANSYEKPRCNASWLLSTGIHLRIEKPPHRDRVGGIFTRLEMSLVYILS